MPSLNPPKFHYFWLVLGLLGSAFLLSRQLAELPLWIDEGWTHAAATQPDFNSFWAFVRADVHPPLYFGLLNLWHKLAGASLVALRVPSFSAALLSIALTYRLTADLFNRRSALIAALIVATSDIVLALTPEVRHYTFYMLLSLLSCATYHYASEYKSKIWAGLHIFFSLLLLYTLYWSVFILLAQALHSLIFRRAQWRAWLIGFSIIGLCYLPWLPIFYEQITRSNPVDSSGYENTLKIDRIGLEIITFQLFGLPEAFFGLFALAGLAHSLKKNQLLPNAKTGLLGLWLFVPVLLPMLITALGFGILTHRPMIALVPPMAILVGHVVAQMPNWGYKLLLAFLLLNNLTTIGAEPPPRVDWWRMGDFLAAHSSPDDVLLIESDFNAYSIEAHAALADAPYQDVVRQYQIKNQWAGERLSSLEEALQNRSSLWLVEYARREDLRPRLAALGYIEMTPSVDLGFYQIDRVLATYYSQPIPNSHAQDFGELRLLHSESFQHGGQLQVNLFWEALTTPSHDYSISVFLLHPDGALAIQHDSYPLNGLNPTSTWQPERPYFDRHSLDISGLGAGAYQLAVRVYTWQDGMIYPTSPCQADDCSYFPLELIELINLP